VVTPPSHRLRRVLFGLGLLTGVWAGVLAWTGGFYVRLGGLPVSSRNPWTALEGAALLLVAGVALTAATRGRAGLREEGQWWASRALQAWHRYGQILPAVAVVVVIAVSEVQQWLAVTPLWLDEETISLNVRDRSFVGLAGPLWLGQSAPLGWLVLVRAVVRLIGTSEVALRLVPLVFAVAMLAVAVWIGRRWLGLLGAFTLAWLCGFSPWLWHYASEVKHYTADACGALLLPALAVWVLEAGTPPGRRARLIAWWAVAAAALWVSNGALLATPVLAVFLTLALWRQDGWRAAGWTAVIGFLWFGSFGLDYAWSGRYTLASPYLRDFWASKLPAPSLGALDRVQWAWHQLPLLAWNPAGTPLWITLWLCAVVGYGVAVPRRVGLAFALLPLSAFLLGIVGVVPLAERLALWIVPALYMGVALLVDRAARAATEARRRRHWPVLVAAAVAVVLAARLSVDISDRGAPELLFFGTLDTKQGLDDRSAVRWLMAQHQAGDAILTTHMTWPAVWWYGDMPLGDPVVAEGALHDGTGLVEIGYSTTGADCQPDALRHALAGRSRALMYLGFRDVPRGYDNFVVDRLAEIGTIVDLKRFTGLSVAVVIDLTSGRAAVGLRHRPSPVVSTDRPLDGCVAAQPARRW
jgi:hypothetical protein